jgi:hypothetical protein
MLSVIIWTCPCGCMVKAMYNTGDTTVVRCAKPLCTSTHTINGKIVQIWTKESGDVWEVEELGRLVTGAAS